MSDHHFPVDISRIQIRSDLPVTERVRQFVSDVGDPYCFLVQDTVVHVRFRSNASRKSFQAGQ